MSSQLYKQYHYETNSDAVYTTQFNSNFSVLISSCNFDVEKYSLCVYVRYEYTERRHWSRAARELKIKTNDRHYCMTKQMSR